MSSTSTGVDEAKSTEALFNAMLQQLAGGGGTHLVGGPDEDILYHTDPANKTIVVPQGMAMETVSTLADKKARELNKMHSFTHITEFRPEDGAHAAAKVIKEMFGLTIGKTTPATMFSPEKPPAYRTIKISANKSMEVPWGELFIPALEGASFEFGATDSKRGPVFLVQVTSPKKWKVQIEEFFAALDARLAVDSIYRGKAVIGAHELEFMRGVSTFKSEQIVFADHVQRTLNASVFGLLNFPDASRKAGLPTKRTVLAHGPYGTGKTSLAMITAQAAEKAGWTFLSGRAGKDNLKHIMDTAVLYEPAVVFIEDIDTHTPNAADKTAVSELLDVFDGVGTKDSKLLVIMTTNHIDRVPAGMLRPGRLDYIVEINGLDRLGTERLIKRVISPDLLADDIDFDAVYEEMKDWQPAWVKSVADRSQAYALAEQLGDLTYKITTQDLVDSAISHRQQLDLMDKALEGYSDPELHVALGNEVGKAVEKKMEDMAVFFNYGADPDSKTESAVAYRFGTAPEVKAAR